MLKRIEINEIYRCSVNDMHRKVRKREGGGKRYFLFTWFKGDFLCNKIQNGDVHVIYYIYITRIVRTYYVVVKHGENKRAN